MRRRLFHMSAFLVGLLILGPLGGASAVNATISTRSALSPLMQTNEVANAGVIQVHRRDGRRYHRHYYRPYRHHGFYFGPYYYFEPYDGYAYYGYRHRSYSNRCSYWRHRCADNWGFRTHNYYGCLRYHRCW